MIRNLRIISLAVAVTVLGAAIASGAQAAEVTVEGAEEAKETTLTILRDGQGKTAHQVLDISKADGTGVLSLTCNEVTGDATVVGKSFTDFTVVTPIFEGGGAATGADVTDCTFGGQTVKVENTGCNFTFTAGSPQLHIVSQAGKECKHGKQPIELSFGGSCKVEIAQQTIEGVKYHNLADGTVTVEMANLGEIEYSATGLMCPYGTTSNGILTTGNVILTAEKKGTTDMLNLKWHA